MAAPWRYAKQPGPPGRAIGVADAVNTSVVRGLALLLAVMISVSPFSAGKAEAAVSLSITPITWDVIGLDSNDVTTGPNRFPVGARVCAAGGDAANVTATLTWDSANTYVNIRPGSQSPIALGAIASGTCADAYFEVEVTRNAGAYDTTRAYHITATDSGSSATATTPRPRQLYVEHLISQNRNGITSISLNGTAIPAGGTMTLVQGRTYQLTLAGYTATQGYNQLEAFTGLPNTVFQVLSVSTTYSSFGGPVSSPHDQLYANACTWDADPTSPTYRSCVGGDYKAGGTVVTTYQVKVIGGAGDPAETLTSLLYDFSGSSYHYNADAGTGARYVSVVSPSAVPITKSFSPKVIAPDATSTLTFRITNPTPDTLAGITFGDTFPSGLRVAAAPAVTSTGCGAGTFSPVVAADATSLAFSNGTISGYGTCVISVAVTATTAASYVNTTGHLFVDSTVDTGNTGTDTLTVAAASACTVGQTLATWSVPDGTTANPPDLTGGHPTTQAGNVATATASLLVPGNSAITTLEGHGDTTSWRMWGYKNDGQTVTFEVDTSKYSGVSMSYWLANPGISNGPSTVELWYLDGETPTLAQTITNPAGAFTHHTFDFTGLTNAFGSTFFWITGSGANADQSGSALDLDDISFTGCGETAPAPTISKTFLSDSFPLGSSTTLAFHIENQAPGNVDLTGVAVTDVLPDGLGVVDGSGAGCGGTVTTVAATRTIALTGGAVASGGFCDFNVTVYGDAAGAYTNVTGFLSSTQTGTTTAYATDDVGVVEPPHLAKSFTPAAILVGQTSQLTFTVTNPNGLFPIIWAAFDDTLPAGVTVASSGPTSVCGGTVTTTAPSSIVVDNLALAAGEVCTFSLNVTGATAGTKVNTTGAIVSTEGSGGTATATLVVTQPVAAIDLVKEISTTPLDGTSWRKAIGVAVGTGVSYRFKVYNAGDVALDPIVITDPTPVSCTWTDANDDPFTFPLTSGDTAYCVVGPVSALAGSHDNTARASGTTPSETTVYSAWSTATYATTGLTIAKSADEAWFNAADDVLHYTFTVTNSGDFPLLGPVTVDDPLTSDESCPAVTTVGDHDAWLDPDESLDCSATYTVTDADVAAGHIDNTADATADGVTSGPDTVTVPLAALSIIKSSLTTEVTAAGDVVTYSIALTNDGEAILTGIVVDDPSCDSAPVYNSGDTNENGDFESGETWVYVCDRTVTQPQIDGGGNLTNTASATTDQTAEVTDTLNIPISPTAGLTVVKAADEAWFNEAGDTLHYTYTVTNSGATTLAGPVTVDDDLATVTCPPVDTLAPGDDVTCTASYLVTADDVAAGHVTNTATADADGETSPPDSVTVPLAAMTVDKTADLESITGLDVVGYTVTVTNTGELDLTGISVGDPTCDVALAYESGDTGSDDVLGVGEAWTYTCERTVTQDELDAGGDLSNTATASSNETPDATGSVDIPIVQDPELTLEKTLVGTRTFGKVGDLLHYSYVVTNTGNVTIAGPITVTDDKTTVDCPVVASLAPGQAITCTSVYAVTQEDLDAGSVTNTATASGLFGETVVGSSQVEAAAAARPSLTVPPSSTIDQPGSPLRDGGSGAVVLGLLGLIVALAVAVRPRRRSSTSR